MRSLVVAFTIIYFCSDVYALEFRYTGELAPIFWPTLFESCSGSRQSPIAINKLVSTRATFLPFTFNNYNSVPTSATLTNNGHSAQLMLTFTNAPTISGGDLPGTYEFVQYHFHWGSDSTQGAEHTLEGVQYPLELHLVHYNTAYGDAASAMAESDGLAVLGIFFEISQFDNPILEPVITALSSVVEHSTSTDFDHSFRLLDLLPFDQYSFYRYLGSLTTPECREIVVWTVFTSTLPISERQLNAFRLLLNDDNGPLVNNFRPVQPRNSRIIYRNGIPLIPNVCFIPIFCPLLENFFKLVLLVLRSNLGNPLLG